MRFGKLERRADEIEGLAVRVDNHLDDIESENDVRIVEEVQPGERASGD